MDQQTPVDSTTESTSDPEVSDFLDPSKTRLRLDISYDGTNFFGWGKQPVLRTVQGTIEDALSVIFRRFGVIPTLIVAGRTDAGVHASGQVAHLDLTEAQLHSLDRPRRGNMGGKRYDGPASLARRINGIAGLEADIHVSSSEIAADGFDARFSPLWRRYEYRIADNESPRDPRYRNHTVWYPATLDVDAMNSAANELLGLHDWAAYCKPREGASTVRWLEHFRWRRNEEGIIVAEVRADAFCHSMVRSLVGAGVFVGQGKLEIARPVEIRDERSKGSEYKVMPAKGLTLVEVGYPPDDGLAARAELTRSHRVPMD
ncbi:tRNA pseudouridine(38-40) synthase TruA [Salinibacterium sp. M195]|uniref:tRNA pseudouridine synthase A n=1 Tax=Salinibacterium sp. M195 TaxID=2583374 RepID=UPI00210228F3|nr:tRNA pseudouridine synthase A [Salinibacterium sp. M195]